MVCGFFVFDVDFDENKFGSWIIFIGFILGNIVVYFCYGRDFFFFYFFGRVKGGICGEVELVGIV